ncbi:MAG: hypothetical protein V9E87_07740 [Gemmatimonadales bacterium]
MTSRPLPLLLAFTLLIGARTPHISAQSVIQAREDLRLDAEANDLLPIWWLFVSPKGVMVASQQQDRNFRFFSPDGRPLGTFGRNGEGPGEFRRIEGTRAGWIGDTLWLTESGVPRITFVGPDRKLLRMERRPAELLDPRGVAGSATALASPFVAGIAADRSYQMMSMLLPNLPSPAWLTGLTARGFLFFVQGRDGRFVRSIGWSPDGDAACAHREQGVSVRIPFCPPGPIHRAARQESDRARHPRPSERRGRALPASGLQRHHGRYAARPRDLTIDRFRSLHGSRIASAPNVETISGHHPPPERSSPKSRSPEFYPPFSDLLTGRDGTIAIGLYGGPAGRKQWRVFDAAGKDLGVVEFPASVRLYAIERGRAWGTDGEPGDQDSIVRFRW